MATRLKLKLIQPSRYLEDGSILRLKQRRVPSLTLPYLAALTPDDVDVVIENEFLDGVDFDAPVDVVGLTAATIYALRAYEIADEFRRRGVHVVMGGIHPSLEPDEAAEHTDTLITGESEHTWPRFLDDLRSGNPQPRYDADGFPDLAGTPSPRLDLIDRSRYSYLTGKGPYRLIPKPFVPVQTARGCPHGCDFCTVTLFNGRRLRARPVGEVVDELRALGARGCLFLDDNIFANPARAKELFRALKPLGLTWLGQGTIHAARDPELVRLAWESGCKLLVLGIESLSPAHLESIGKTHNVVADYGKHLRTFGEMGIAVLAAMMFGFDGEEPEVFDEACDFLIRNRVAYTSWQPLTPYPGTAVYARLREQGRLKDERWWLNRGLASRFTTLKFTGVAMGEEVFFERFHRAYRRFYSLGSIARRILLPPQKRWLRKTVLNLHARGRLTLHQALAET